MLISTLKQVFNHVHALSKEYNIIWNIVMLQKGVWPSGVWPLCIYGSYGSYAIVCQTIKRDIIHRSEVILRANYSLLYSVK